jgi:hypothetical protein
MRTATEITARMKDNDTMSGEKKKIAAEKAHFTE